MMTGPRGAPCTRPNPSPTGWSQQPASIWETHLATHANPVSPSGDFDMWRDLLHRKHHDGQMEAGIRELRDHLSRYLELDRDGEEVTVTDHGKAVARLVPLDSPRPLDRLIAEGLVTPRRTASGRGRSADRGARQRQ